MPGARERPAGELTVTQMQPGDQPAGGSAHFALMDRVYRRQRYIYDLTRKYYLLGRDRLIRELGAAPGQSVVEVGCGTARNLIKIAEAYPGARLYGFDASREMLKTAEESVARAGLTGRIRLTHGLAEEMTPDLFGLRELFDHVVFSYSLSMIPDWRGALRAAAGATHPKGAIHAVDFGDLAGLWPPAQRALRAWLRRFHVAPRDKLLKVLERDVGGRTPATSLRILPGRYAFVLRAPPSAIVDLVSTAVAA